MSKCKICWHATASLSGKYICPFDKCEKEEARKRLDTIKKRHRK